jgi:hypothetical protein
MTHYLMLCHLSPLKNIFETSSSMSHHLIRPIFGPAQVAQSHRAPKILGPQNPNTLLLFLRPFFHKTAQLLSLGPNYRHPIFSMRKETSQPPDLVSWSEKKITTPSCARQGVNWRIVPLASGQPAFVWSTVEAGMCTLFPHCSWHLLL